MKLFVSSQEEKVPWAGGASRKVPSQHSPFPAQVSPHECPWSEPDVLQAEEMRQGRCWQPRRRGSAILFFHSLETKEEMGADSISALQGGERGVSDPQLMRTSVRASVSSTWVPGCHNKHLWVYWIFKAFQLELLRIWKLRRIFFSCAGTR